jgi:Undecaprenyl-phosphate galactose phosphotransferase WbaP
MIVKTTRRVIDSTASPFERDDVSSPAVRAIEIQHTHSLAGTRSGLPMRLTYLTGDLVALVLAIAIARVVAGLATGAMLSTWDALHVKLFSLWAAGLLTIATLERTYAAIPPRPVRHFRGWVLGAAAVCGIEIGTLWLLGIATVFDYATLALATSVAAVLASFMRAFCRMRFGKASWWGTRLIVVGSGGSASDVFADLEREPQWGLRPVGFVDNSALFDSDDVSSNFLGSVEHLDEVAAQLRVDRALVIAPSFDSEELAINLCRVGSRIRHWIILPPLDRFPSVWLQECEAARRPALSVTNRLALPWTYALKRGFDLAITGCVGLLALPLIVALGLLVMLTSRGPMFYGQERIGRGGRRFKAWKFRTMVPNADAVLAGYLAQHPELSAEWEAFHKLKRDPRITWMGRWLRALSLDEIPQIWNVLIGDMSLVGPRPIVSAETRKYADRYQQYSQVLPGITGLWQVSGRNNTTYAERVDLDAYYVQNWSIWLDLYILACTIKVVLLGEGAY